MPSTPGLQGRWLPELHRSVLFFSRSCSVLLSRCADSASGMHYRRDSLAQERRREHQPLLGPPSPPESAQLVQAPGSDSSYIALLWCRVRRGPQLGVLDTRLMDRIRHDHLRLTLADLLESSFGSPANTFGMSWRGATRVCHYRKERQPADEANEQADDAQQHLSCHHGLLTRPRHGDYGCPERVNRPGFFLAPGARRARSPDLLPPVPTHPIVLLRSPDRRED